MKKYLFYGVMSIILILTIASCAKDRGNYLYHPINEISFSNFDTAKGYQVLFGDSLKIHPTLSGTLDKNATGDYSYAWSWVTYNQFQNEIDSVFSTTKDLNAPVKLFPGTYTLQYRVTDNGTGVTFQARTKVNVTTAVYEGYLLLNKIGGQSRLDMLSYDAAKGSFAKYIDVLKMQGSTVPMNGIPYQVYCATYVSSNIATRNYGIFILNSSGCNRIDQETFGYDPEMNIRSLFIGDVPEDFAPTHMMAEWIRGIVGYPQLYLFDGNGNVYSASSFSGYAFHYTPLNVYSAGAAPFPVASYGVTNGAAGSFYDVDKKAFAQNASYNSVVLNAPASSLNYPSGYNLIYMDKDYNNNAFAILEDPATSDRYLMRFPIGGAQTYFQKITGTDIAQATHFASSPAFGYLFYSVGGKVYEYDPSLRTSILMIDKGASSITYLNFQHFFNRGISTVNPKYSTWADYLNVASYGSSETSGTFELYNIPPINGQLTLVPGCSWTGFGEIVSVSYRER